MSTAAVPAHPARAVWQVSWPLLMGAYVFLVGLHTGHIVPLMLMDGDTYWHIAAGRWIVEHTAVPTHDPFSHSMPGGPWVAKEWLSQILLARAHHLGGWTAVVALTSLAFSITFALLCRALLGKLEPMRALLFTTLAVLMAVSHLLARPFVLAMPLMMLWMVELFEAADAERAPRLWLLPVMILWANMHSGFTLGLAIALALAGEAMLTARSTARFGQLASSWSVFVVLAAAGALLTPQGIDGFLFTWQVMGEDTFALSRISEWASPNFHGYQPLLFWLLGVMALVLHQGLRLPPVRLALLLGLLYLSLKHVRNIELLGLIGPLVVARPFSRQWRPSTDLPLSMRRDDLFLRRLVPPAGLAASLACAMLLAGAVALLHHLRPVKLPEYTVPSKAFAAIQSQDIKGRVLNDYGFGGALIYHGVAPGIDGRQDLYRDAFMKRYIEALDLTKPNSLQDLLASLRIDWTLLRPGTPAIALLDVLPGWKRIYTDETAVIHVHLRADTPVDEGPRLHPTK